ncbi:hypothetical protein [uncultured Thermanaerothrix sp.]|uniref:hypothetical protein n=1 Tax=uncultured Thermanaerothrix sp. TaxID=1195149 RepID=UPI0026285761|nr:hypothetical protein [uncultured Thermanaerothrix sp.]
MPKIRCHYIDCAFLDEGYCSAALIELDPDSGCLTYSPTAETPAEEEWEEEEELEEWEDLEELEEEEEEEWLDDEEEF